MEGFFVAIVFLFPLVAGALFITFYAMLVKANGRFRNFRILIAFILSVIAGVFSIITMLTYAPYSLFLLIIAVMASLTYLATPTLETLAKPRNLILILRYKMAKTTHPFVFALLLAFVCILGFFVFASLFL